MSARPVSVAVRESRFLPLGEPIRARFRVSLAFAPLDPPSTLPRPVCVLTDPNAHHLARNLIVS